MASSCRQSPCSHQGHRRGNRRRHRPARSARIASRCGGQKLPDRLLLHLGHLDGQDLGPACHRGHQRLAPCANQASRQHDLDRGYVCTLSVLVLKSRSAHLFHVGDRRIYRVVGQTLEQLTEDHRVVVSSRENYLGRALGAEPNVEIDYRPSSESGRPVRPRHRRRLRVCRAALHRPSHRGFARRSRPCGPARGRGGGTGQRRQPHGTDRADRCPAGRRSGETDRAGPRLCRCRPPEPRSQFDGYRIVRQLHSSSRSHIYLAATGVGHQGRRSRSLRSTYAEDAAYLRALHHGGMGRATHQAARTCSSRATERGALPVVVTEYRRGADAAAMDDRPPPARSRDACATS